MELLIEKITDKVQKILREFGDDEQGKFNVRSGGGITFANVNDGLTLYHRPKDAEVIVANKKTSVINSVFKYGFSREFTDTNGGNMYGAGVYTVYNLRSSNEKATGYGKAIIMVKLVGGLQDFLIFSEQLARQTYGKDWDIKTQVKKLFSEREAKLILRSAHLVMHDDTEKDFDNMKKSSQSALKVIDLIGMTNLTKTKCRGIIYNGGHDGACCLIYDFSSAIPVAISYDNGRTWQNRLTQELLDRMNNEVDTEFQFGLNKEFANVANKSINGYTMVWNKEGKVNYVPAKENQPISNIWFDEGTNWENENGMLYTTVKYHDYYFKIIFEDGEYVIYDDDFEPMDCTLAELPNLFTESRKNYKTIIRESIKKILAEAQIKVDNFDKIAKIMDINSPDDFYFVQIIKRFKDNQQDNRSIGNYHAGAWYLGGFRVHDANELFALKNQIINACEQNNARAYITVNTRSEKQTDDFIKVYKSKFRPSDARYKFADQIVPAQAKSGRNWRGQRKRLFIDIDVPKTARTRDGKNIWDEVRHMISMVGIKSLGEYETPSGGLHIILPDKEDGNYEYLKKLFHKFDDWKDKGKLATVHPNEDGKIILYSNVQTKGY